jgi:DNA polymerase elongation subunit (family B)
VFEHAKNVKEVEALVPAALEKAKEFIALLRSGKADPLDLIIRRHISQEADEYRNRSASAEVAKALDEAGIKLAPGEMIEYIILDATGRKKPEKARPLALYSFDDGYDIEKYTEMALKAVETLLLPWGWDVEKLRAIFVGDKKSKAKSTTLPAQMELIAGDGVSP